MRIFLVVAVCFCFEFALSESDADAAEARPPESASETPEVACCTFDFGSFANNLCHCFSFFSPAPPSFHVFFLKQHFFCLGF